jgi:nitroimidazol reductase NimA-like FMN-containing flavoprotein (pyridoxamine 5'-phosphate oxidase superfamily)
VDPYREVDTEALGRQECLRLLGAASLGRVAFTADALPSVQPVTFVLHDGDVVLRIREGSALDVALRGAVVAFEIDDYDPADHSGWSVTGIGPAAVVTDQDRLDELARLPLPRWAPDGKESFVTISMAILHGRRIVADGHRQPGE